VRGSGYESELGPFVINRTCECCGRPIKRVWGFVSKGNVAHAVYYSLLVDHNDGRWVIHTLSVGNWWDDKAISERVWVCLQSWSDDRNFNVKVLEPEVSSHFPWKSGGAPLGRREALADPRINELFEVTDFINAHDPAIKSFLSGDADVDITGRGCKHEDRVDYGGQALPQ
jgi:hypothetical protein